MTFEKYNLFTCQSLRCYSCNPALNFLLVPFCKNQVHMCIFVHTRVSIFPSVLHYRKPLEYQTLSLFSCCRPLWYSSPLYPNGQFAPNLVFHLFFHYIRCTVLYALDLIHSALKLDYWFIHLIEFCILVLFKWWSASALLFSFPFLCTTVKLKPANS